MAGMLVNLIMGLALYMNFATVGQDTGYAKETIQPKSIQDTRLPQKSDVKTYEQSVSVSGDTMDIMIHTNDDQKMDEVLQQLLNYCEKNSLKCKYEIIEQKLEMKLKGENMINHMDAISVIIGIQSEKIFKPQPIKKEETFF